MGATKPPQRPVMSPRIRKAPSLITDPDPEPAPFANKLSNTSVLGVIRAKDKFKQSTDWLHWAIDEADDDGPGLSEESTGGATGALRIVTAAPGSATHLTLPTSSPV